MMSKQGKKEESQSSGGGRKTSSLRPPEQTLRCPRCDSSNTKFCYYNNYNLTQPRHFCKTCRRYWTKGGALRNIPVGGGCRKNKNKPKPSASSNGGLKPLDGLPPPIMDFQLGGISFPPRLNQFCYSYGESSSNSLPIMMNLDPPLGLGFHLPLSTHATKLQEDQSGGGLASTFHQNASLTTSSMESLNQDLHWRLHQQPLAIKETGLQPILFQNLEITKPPPSSSIGNGSVGGLATEWFFHNNYAPVNPNPTSAINPENVLNGNFNNWNGIQGWNHMNQYTSFP